MPRCTESKPGYWLGRLPEGTHSVLAFGYRFYPPGRGNGAFRRSYSRSTVYVFAVIETWLPGQDKPTCEELVPDTPVGEARLVRDADRIGRKGVREIVRPALDKRFPKTA